MADEWREIEVISTAYRSNEPIAKISISNSAGLRFAINTALAKKIGWRGGDRVKVDVSMNGRQVARFRLTVLDDETPGGRKLLGHKGSKGAVYLNMRGMIAGVPKRNQRAVAVRWRYEEDIEALILEVPESWCAPRFEEFRAKPGDGVVVPKKSQLVAKAAKAVKIDPVS